MPCPSATDALSVPRAPRAGGKEYSSFRCSPQVANDAFEMVCHRARKMSFRAVRSEF